MTLRRSAGYTSVTAKVTLNELPRIPSGSGVNRSTFEQVEFVRLAVPVIGVGRGALHFSEGRPCLRKLGIQCDEMLLVLRNLIFRKNGICGAFGLAEGAINTLIRVDDKKVRAFVKTIHRANIHTIGVLALDAVFCDYESHYMVLSSEMMTVGLSLGPSHEEAMKGESL